MNHDTFRRFRAGAALLPLLALATCDERPPAGPAAWPPLGAASRPHSNSAASLAVAKLEKPCLVGPLSPAIVILPDKYPQPTIRVLIAPEQNSRPALATAAYRGKVEAVKLPNGHYIGLNTLPLDSYLQGVLAKELYGSWDIEAFRTQAVAARTYALYQIFANTHDRAYDVTDNEGSQMYGGIAGETPRSRQAVADTAGQVLIARYGDKSGIFCAYYSACHGGATQDPSEAWGDYPVAPLSARIVGNIDAGCSRYTWPTMTLKKEDLQRCVNNWGEHNGFTELAALGPIHTVIISERNATTNRPTVITLTDVQGKSAVMRAEEFRLSLVLDPAGSAPKPFSSWFDIKDAGRSLQLVNGRGYGHGIGLSQWGAQAMALNGHNYKQILSFYYPTSTLRTLW